MKLTGSQLVAEILLEHGVDTVFGYPGGTASTYTTRCMNTAIRSGTY